MSVWFCLPSKRVDGGTIPLWRSRGYRIAVMRDMGDQPVEADICRFERYPGYAQATNAMIHCALAADPECNWVVIGGDDIEPDANRPPEEIAEQCRWHFHAAACVAGKQRTCEHFHDTFGVMQPTGDRWQEDANGSALVDRVCGSAWIGREFCERAYGGNGPLHPGYHHMYVDEELQAVALKFGVLWQRRDLIQLHRHWGRHVGGKRPAFLEFVNSPKHWADAKRMFESRKALAFPGSELR